MNGHVEIKFTQPFFVALNSLSDKWSPALQIRTVLLSIQALLSAPNPDDPLANDVAEQWKTNEAQAIETGEILVCIHFLATDAVIKLYIVPWRKSVWPNNDISSSAATVRDYLFNSQLIDHFFNSIE